MMFSKQKTMFCISVKAFSRTHKQSAVCFVFIFLGTSVKIWHIHTPYSAENWQNRVRQDAFPCHLCVVCVFGTVVRQNHKTGSVGKHFTSENGSSRDGKQSFWNLCLKTMTVLSTSVYPIIPQQDLSSSGTQTRLCLFQIQYWKLGLLILLWMLHTIQVPRRKTSSIAWAVFVCLVLSLSAKEAIFISSGPQGAPPSVAVDHCGGSALSNPWTAVHLKPALAARRWWQ